MLFGVVVFLSAFLLFQLQLVVAKHLLPWFGGTPSVWTTSQMFFQVLLLGGYAYAHLLTARSSIKVQSRIHLVLLIAATLSVFWLLAWGGQPLLAPTSMRPAGAEHPVALLLLILLVSVGLPFFAVSTTAPLLQRWHSRQSSSLDRTYRLYALSNAGSLLALLSYPFGVERLLDLPQQGWVWAAMFTVFAAACALIVWRLAWIPDASPGVTPESDEASESRSSVVGFPALIAWLLLAVTGSVMFLATTNQLTQDVAAVPFLWALPLAIYLLTFILCFSHHQWYSRRAAFVGALVTAIAVLPPAARQFPLPLQVVATSVFLFSFCMLCHGELVRLRPGARQLTLFYLVVALGGALGGVFVSIVAPAVFPDLWEFHGAVTAGIIVIGITWWIDRTSPIHHGDRWLFAALTALTALLGIRFGIERTRLGNLELMTEHGWPITFGAVGIITGIVCAALWRSRIARATIWPQLLVLIFAVMAVLVLVQRVRTTGEGTLDSARNFYGVVRVISTNTPAGEARELRHGTTTHGVQLNPISERARPTAYYSPSSGIAIVSTGLKGGPEALHFGIIGMGIGTMSAFAGAGDRVRYYEINPAVVALVQGDQPYFTFVKESAADTTIVLGDARLTLERELAESGSQRFDLLVMDAFSSDAVPVHLLTIEAFRLYAAHLASDRSILAVNVTNRFLDLEPVVVANARELGFHGLRVDSEGNPPVLTSSRGCCSRGILELWVTACYGSLMADPGPPRAI